MFSRFAGKTAPKEEVQIADGDEEDYGYEGDFIGEDDFGSLDTKELKMLQEEEAAQMEKEGRDEDDHEGGFGFSFFTKKEEVYIEVSFTRWERCIFLILLRHDTTLTYDNKQPPMPFMGPPLKFPKVVERVTRVKATTKTIIENARRRVADSIQVFLLLNSAAVVFHLIIHIFNQRREVLYQWTPTWNA